MLNLFRREKTRMIFVVLAGLLCYSLLIFQFFKLQVLEHHKWYRIAHKQHLAEIKEFSRRGRIFTSTINSRHPTKGEAIATEVLHYHLHVDPELIPQSSKPKLISLVCKLPQLKEKGEWVADELSRVSRSRRLAMWLNERQMQSIRQEWISFAKEKKLPKNALFFIRDYKRSYPYKSLLGQVLHTTQDLKNPKTHESIPTGGLELFFHHYLKGKPCHKVILRSPSQPLDTFRIIEHGSPGSDIILTINKTLQAICEMELKKGVTNARAKSGNATMMDPYTGEILAMAQYPFFDVSKYKEYYKDPDLIESTTNKSIQDAYEPGSVIKPLTGAILLNANEELLKRGEKPLFDPEEKIRADNPHFAHRKPLHNVGSYKYVNFDMAIQKSSNIYLARFVELMIQRLGANWYRSQLANFGFGKTTGIELPSESPGFLPSPKKYYATRRPQWSLPTPISLSIGYNLTASNLQVLRAYAVFANGGYLVKPTLIKHVDHPNYSKKTQMQKKRVLPQSVAKRVVKSLRYVTMPGGIGTAANVYGYTVAGKTTTSEKLVNGRYSKSKHHARFIGFAPVNKPRFVLIIDVDEPEKHYVPGFGSMHFGGNSAAPIFREIAKRTLAFLGEPMDDPYGFGPNDPRSDPSKMQWMKETIELNKRFKEWNN